MNKSTVLGKLLLIQQGVQASINAMSVTNPNSLTPEQWEESAKILDSSISKFKEFTIHVLTSLENRK